MFNKSNIATSLSVVTVLIGLSMLSGCGSKKVPLTPVSGTVSYKGANLKFGTVFFVPKGAGAEMPKGTIQPDGKFQMGTYRDGDGSPLGDFYIRVSCLDTQAPGYVAPTDREAAPGKSLIPSKHSEPCGGGLEVKVEKGMAPLELKLD